jgi:hypothetical protein
MVTPTVLTAFWNRHKKFKKKKYIKPSHCVICVTCFQRKIININYCNYFEKSLFTNELSCIKILIFQAKWPMSWPQSWHCLLKWSHIQHNCTTWNGKQKSASMAVYVFYCNAQSKSHSDPRDIYTLSLFYQLPNCNLFTQHVVIYLMERHH